MVTNTDSIVHTPRRTRWLLGGTVVFCASIFGLISYLKVHPYVELPFDDSYISQVFARNYFQTGGLSFAGEGFTGGATSPPHILILASVRIAIQSPVLSGITVGIICHLAMILLYCLMLAKLKSHPYVITISGIILGTSGFLITDALNGLETSLFHVLAAGASLAFLWDRCIKSRLILGFALGGLIATRPEGMAIAAVFLLFEAVALLKNRNGYKPISKMLAASILPMLLILLAARWQDLSSGGTAGAKLALWGEIELPLSDKVTLLTRALTGFWTPQWGWIIPGIVAGMYVFYRQKAGTPLLATPEIQLVLLWIVFAVLFYSVYFVLAPSALTHLDFRYQHILLPPAVFISTLMVDRTFSRWQSQYRRAVVMLLSVMVLCSAVHGHVYSRPIYSFFTQVSRNSLLRTAQWIHLNTDKKSIVAAHDIGALGYASGRRVLDLSGLTDAALRPYTKSRDVFSYLKQEKPNYLVILPKWAWQYLGLDPEAKPSIFKEEFRSGMAYGEPYVVYRCVWDVDSASAG